MSKDSDHNTLTLTGEGQVNTRPDMAQLNLGVRTEARTAQEASQRNAELMNQVVRRIKGLNIAAEDLQTVGFNISPIIDYQDNSPTYGQITGYRVEDTLSVKCDVALAGKVLDEGVEAGANVAGSLSFGLRNEAPLRQRALQAAVQAAHGDAELVARAMGVRLRGARSAEILYGGSPVIARAALQPKASTSFEPGQLSISASVRMVYTYGDEQESKA